MDKVTLTKEQLKVLVKFIHSRGFREPSMVMDILDHFACKVEEKMQATPSIALEQAMQDAHRDFGVSGFRNLAASHQGQFETRQRRVFKKNARDLLANIPFVFGVGLLAAAYYKGHMWAELNNVTLLWGTNVFSIGLWLVFVVGTTKLNGGLPKRYLKTSTADGYTTSMWSWIGFALFFTTVRLSPDLTGAGQMPAAYTTLVLVYLVFYFAVEYKTINKLFENYQDLEHMLLELEQ
ncbi:MAG: hypothetical protein EOP56_14240 [Sphingobacteriales bacterium]|nr:MAG: hypothetical protein EOP56_14240 [Sphingobacteriales bacterium]